MAGNTILHWITSFFFFSPSFFCIIVSLLLFIYFFFGLERENVKQSDEKKSVGYFNCNVFILFYFILRGFFLTGYLIFTF